MKEDVVAWILMIAGIVATFILMFLVLTGCGDDIDIDYNVYGDESYIETSETDVQAGADAGNDQSEQPDNSVDNSVNDSNNPVDNSVNDSNNPQETAP